MIVVVGLATGIIGQKGSEYLKKKGVLAQLESKKNYVAIVVSAVQQVYAEANGDAKLQEAKAQLIDLFNKNGMFRQIEKHQEKIKKRVFEAELYLKTG